MMPPRAVTFDFGQTLAELDPEFLSRRLAERGVRVAPAALAQAVPVGFARYDAAIRAGEGGHPWQSFMRATLEAAGVGAAARDQVVPWLWDEQPRHNLWRKPIPGMIELAQRLGRAGTRVGVISNAEGTLAELIELLGWSAHFAVVADSGRLGIEKPARGIFDWTAAELGVALGEIVHIGDSRAADVDGALGCGARAVWFGPGAHADGAPPGALVARDAAALAEVLDGLDVARAKGT